VIDQGTEMLHHPLLRTIPRIDIPQAWTVCGGPAYVLAARSLARQLVAKAPHGQDRAANDAVMPDLFRHPPVDSAR
jgi:iron complex transport system substrate-binding protein